ncbi:hypothetical protein M2137_001183 [Parabacteroides sp. PFB2-10]|uniref:DUF4876 domain-containing protein n=1 Tax=Parabacteroides sp. PFB2-10 TaxID=1742405 RepID=UPI0024772C23|nr:DUF4876 domain-containing protein [Parabacteroides sp. PFB2-10]MDH6312412.1 hypothetical protein [Parabacteroides sp. PFB2-10]
MKNKTRNSIFYVAILFWIFATSCREDNAPDSYFVEPFEIHLTYEGLGESRAFTNLFDVTLTNNTEQFTYKFTSDEWGKLMLEKLMPGEYTINIMGELTAEEVAWITGEADAKKAPLAGFVSGVNLKLGAASTLDPIKLIPSTSSSIIFKELYYAGSRTLSNGTYRNDGFFSIYNNSLAPIEINDLYIGMVENFGGIGQAGPLWPGEELGNYQHIYLKSAWKIVAGEEPVGIGPGQTLTIAVMAAPHNKDAQYNLNSPVDLSAADYEAYSNDPRNPNIDFPAPNMRLAFWPDYAFLWRMGVFGQGMVLIAAAADEFENFDVLAVPESFQDPFENEEYWLCKKVPISYVIDAVDLIQNSTVTNTKRFPPSLDAGFATVAGTYLSKSVIRKVKERVGGIAIYQDTNNSTEDFVINDTPLSE